MRGDHLLFSCALFALSLNHICLSSGYCPYVPGIGAENGVLSVSAMGNKLQDDHGLVDRLSRTLLLRDRYDAELPGCIGEATVGQLQDNLPLSSMSSKPRAFVRQRGAGTLLQSLHPLVRGGRSAR